MRGVKIFCRNGHGGGLSGSGTSTPRTLEATIITDEYDKTAVSTSSEASSPSINEKTTSDSLKRLGRRKDSFTKAFVVGLPSAKTSGGPEKEHSEQGKVKKDVYVKYIQAASTSGFILFLLATITQQGTSILGNIVLKSWGEHNRQTGSNSGMAEYLIAYGLSSLASCLLGGIAAIIMWVLISLRSARHLHDSVSPTL